MLHIKKDDEVMVISGKSRGDQGTVLQVLPQEKRAIVQNINFVKKHTSANPQQNIQGGIVEREAPIHLSNLMLICPECKERARVGVKIATDGVKVRICKKCSATITQ